ncbi:MAG: hypothetical protein WCO44_04615 [Bacteroidota bacterium]
MARSSREEKFLQLRKQFPVFIFEKQEYTLSADGLHIGYHFNLAGQYSFYPAIFIPRKSFFLPDSCLEGCLDNIVFNIGMIELISYWKAACPPLVVIRPFALQPAQVAWWKKLYFYGLGEFFFLNSIPATMEDFMQIEIESPRYPGVPKYSLDDAVLLPVGGGKDSAVTLELLGAEDGTIPLIMNPRGASLETIFVKGFTTGQYVEIRRTLDPLLLKLNEEGFLNGHTPFSALLAFVTVLAAIVSGRRYIALSNESSANEATIAGTEINHQYSKSFGFEAGFRDYVKQWISPEIEYFSFLRPLNELQIASLFAQYRAYHPVFKSCNAGSKSDSWCGKCAKCLFTYIMLSPFLTEDDLIAIFGKNLFSDPGLETIFLQLTGMAEEKPFDCVGTIREVNLALCETIRQREEHGLPFLLDYYRRTANFSDYDAIDFAGELFRFSGEHFLPAGFLERLMNAGIDKNEDSGCSGS